MIYPKQYNLTCYRGQTWTQNIYLEDKNHTPIDLTGYTVRSQVRPSENSTTLTQEVTCSVDIERGKVSLIIPAANTATILPGKYVYDVKFVDTNNEVTYYICGDFIVKGRVTE